ncbi:hypothetical protein LP422_13700 [Janibacter limosus]|uniref:Uncharacterized protein n=1 Tax=Janibacter limosus TaxID=53458 RepID=A0AC61U9K4_9MICO|nr:hypothetical protein [Janibacter limosus]UUZ46476.1 hypothetical protein LP422_13700 [Janibacter limosus]
MTATTPARRTPRTVPVLVGCVAVLALVCLLSLAVGSKATSLPEVIDALTRTTRRLPGDRPRRTHRAHAPRPSGWGRHWPCPGP